MNNTFNSARQPRLSKFELHSCIKSNMGIVMDSAHILPKKRIAWELKQKRTMEESHAANIRAHKAIFDMQRGKYEEGEKKRVLVMKPAGRGKFKLLATGGVVVKNAHEASEYGSRNGYTHLKNFSSDKLTYIRYYAPSSN